MAVSFFLVWAIASVVPRDRDYNCAAKTDFNSTRTFRRFPEPNLVPWPREIQASAAYFSITNDTRVAVPSADAIEMTAAALLIADVLILTGGNVNLTIVVASEPPLGSIWLRVLKPGAAFGSFSQLKVK